MSKFYLKCPNCGKYHLASSGLFSHKHIDCECGYSINVKKDRMATLVCPKCSNTVVYDQANKDNVYCPVCHSHLDPFGDINKVNIHCPTCNLLISIDKTTPRCNCPVCDSEIDVQKQIIKENASSNNQISIIKYEGSNDVICFKYPIEDFLVGSELIVSESQEAIFLKDGVALDSFGPGRYFLTTDRLPIISKKYKLETNQKTQPFHCEIYFINMSTIMGIKWGTPSKIGLFDPHSGLHVQIGLCGTFNLTVNEPRKFLFKIVGTTNGLLKNDIISDNTFTGLFKDLVISKVKSNLPKIIKNNDINILEIDEHTDDISSLLKKEINITMEEYGLIINDFFVTNILLPDDDPNFKKMKEQYAERYLKVTNEEIKKTEAVARHDRVLIETDSEIEIELAKAKKEAEIMRIKADAEAYAYRAKAGAEADEMKMKGYSYQDETKRKVATGAVNHLDNNGNSNDGITGLATDVVKVSIIKEVGKELINSVSSDSCFEKENYFWDCPTCGTKEISTKFCPNCGQRKPSLVWDCPCGTKNIKSKFCPNCGKEKL